MTPRTLGPFEIHRQLGVGGMGIVYLATYKETGQRVALKILSPAFNADTKLVKRFKREIDILKKLEHPNIVRYFGGGKHGEQRYYAMEYIDGGSLDRVLAKKKQLSWEQALKIGLQLCSALEHAHNNGVIHRDLKPGNLFVSKKGRIRLGDFGIARDNDATALTAAGKTVGTYAYMAPEQIHGKHPIGPKTDLYAMGCLLFQFLTGHVPFQGDNAATMFMQHLNDEPASVREEALDCPVWFDRVIQRLLQKEPEDRPYDALAVHALLEDVRDRVARGAGVAQDAMTRGPGTTEVAEADRTELHKALGKKKKKRKKKKKNVPIHERTSFLVVCLAALIGAVTWAVWPLSESKLHEKIMETASVELDRDTVLEELIPEYQERFPEGEHMKDVLRVRDTLEMADAEEEIKTDLRMGRQPDTEAGKKFVEAKDYEDKFDDKVTALQQFEALEKLFEGREADRPHVNLARREIKRLRDEIANGTAQKSALEVIWPGLMKAEGLYANGAGTPEDTLKAKDLWRSIVRLYGKKAELKRYIDYASARIDGREVQPIDFNKPPVPPARD